MDQPHKVKREATKDELGISLALAANQLTIMRGTTSTSSRRVDSAILANMSKKKRVATTPSLTTTTTTTCKIAAAISRSRVLTTKITQI